MRREKPPRAEPSNRGGRVEGGLRTLLGNVPVVELARRENVYCKISGMVTEAEWHSWNEAQLGPYMETVLAAFGPGRLMFGSDWPVLNLASDYTAWVELVKRAIDKLSPHERQQILAKTAVEAYAL